jgi:Fe-S-cluster containining protein
MLKRNPCAEHGCAACCYDTEMPVMEEDVTRLVALGHAREAFTTRGEGGFLQLQTVEPAEGMPGRPCFFLKENKCSVYADRPTGCRIYPMVLNEAARLLRDEDCPPSGASRGMPSDNTDEE